ncbi:hypothetical protein [Massilia antarctica]|uniref:hypothetical protein n=1 Tax=Massilia antarctica TaxID=2765360 RepID=UPI0006BB708B|nr:hypothetical protein [Massilia sp. H27-R4]MCY0912801.1 hypothetical protein [Massilia sp. H27-R4]CUI03938.1 hypothetical protein BN2497_2653 [Janthinobacterium sp. CG23_2]CUU27724.1 hypothetical protein BN3177_2653 [Janthinobacterium sp. CG23_2]
MNSATPSIDDCARQGRAVLMTVLAALLVVAALALAATLGALGPWSDRLRRAAPMAPLAIILFCAWARRRQHNAGADAWQALFQDEFRQQSITRAVRAAFIFLLLAQIPLASLLECQAAAPHPLAMACLNMLVGAIAFLSAFLYFERPSA